MGVRGLPGDILRVCFVGKEVLHQLTADRRTHLVTGWFKAASQGLEVGLANRRLVRVLDARLELVEKRIYGKEFQG